MSRDITKRYTNGEVTIIWKPSLCIHSGRCFMGLPEVFKPDERPWVTPEGASTERIIAQVKRCPSGALSFETHDAALEQQSSADPPPVEIEVRKGGPYVVRGTYQIIHSDGTTEVRERNTSFCRCGHSRNKPFCDGTHRKIEFDQ